MALYKNTANFSLVIVICLLVKLAFVNVFADDNKQNDANKNSQVKSEQSSTPIKPNIGKRSRVKTLEEFIPSEEVSADKPVAFPSDI